MPKPFVWIGWLAGGIAIYVSAFGLMLSSLSSGMCANTILTEVMSPDRERRAVVFQRDCGATTGFSTQVSILRAGDSLPDDDGGNAFVADTDHGAAPAGPDGSPEVTVRWEGPNALVLEHDSRARVFHAIPLVGTTRVSFVPR